MFLAGFFETFIAFTVDRGISSSSGLKNIVAAWFKDRVKKHVKIRPVLRQSSHWAEHSSSEKCCVGSAKLTAYYKRNGFKKMLQYWFTV